MRIVQCERQRHAAAILVIFNDAIANSTALYDYKPRTMEMMGAWFDAKAKGKFPVIGIESDAAWSDIQHTEGFFGIASAQERIKSFGSVTGRLGVAVCVVPLPPRVRRGLGLSRHTMGLFGLDGSRRVHPRPRPDRRCRSNRRSFPKANR